MFPPLPPYLLSISHHSELSWTGIQMSNPSKILSLSCSGNSMDNKQLDPSSACRKFSLLCQKICCYVCRVSLLSSAQSHPHCTVWANPKVRTRTKDWYGTKPNSLLTTTFPLIRITYMTFSWGHRSKVQYCCFLKPDIEMETSLAYIAPLHAFSVTFQFAKGFVTFISHYFPFELFYNICLFRYYFVFYLIISFSH